MILSKPIQFLLAAALIGFAALACAQESWVEESNQHTMKMLQAGARFNPEGVAGLGVTGFDDQIVDLGENITARRLQDYTDRLAYLQEQLKTVEHPKVRQDLEILMQAMEDAITSTKLNEKYMLPYYNLGSTLFFGFQGLLDPRVPAERYPAALTRLKRYAGLEEGYEPITVLARARTEEKLDQAGLVGPYRGELERDLDNIPRQMAGVKDLFANAGLEGWEEDFDVLNRQMTEYADWLRADVLPRARTNHRLPEEIYADNLKNFGVDADPNDLIRQAQIGFGSIRNEMQAIARRIAAERGLESGDYRDVMRELKKQQIPEDEVLPLYRERLEIIEEIIREQEIVTLPEREAAIRLATEAESTAIPAPFLNPPPLIGNTGQPAEFVLVTSDPATTGEAGVMDDWTHDAITWALAVHEARPGHELQFSMMIENGVSQARAIYAFNSANVEGWGLYAEAIMHQFLPLEGQLFSLQARLARATRAFMDPMLNLGLIEPDKALDFLMQDVGLSRSMAQSEVDRYTFIAPGQATSYYYGFLNMMRLRTEVEILLPDQFSQQEFHDFVLAQGLLPPEVLRQAVLEEFVPAHASAGL